MSYDIFPCGECYQVKSCGMEGRPLHAMDAHVSDGERILMVLSPEDCFYMVCREGALMAARIVHETRSKGESGWKPFGTLHKPHVDNSRFSGRAVFVADETNRSVDIADYPQLTEYQTGDVAIDSSVSGVVQLTNIFTNEPPKGYELGMGVQYPLSPSI